MINHLTYALQGCKLVGDGSGGLVLTFHLFT
jgi:hypothetical protein